jgi:hypothetical protein
MKWTTAPDRLTPAAAGVLATAVGALVLLLVFRGLWHNATSTAALDANEGLATLTWLAGWGLLIAAVIASVSFLAAAIHDVVRHGQASLINVIACAASIAVVIAAVTISPAWGTGSATG